MGWLADKLAQADLMGENDHIHTGWICSKCQCKDMSVRYKPNVFYFDCPDCKFKTQDFPIDCPVSNATEEEYKLWFSGLGLPARIL